MTERILDWRPRHDSRSLDFRIKRLTPDKELRGRNRVWKRTIWLDQGSEGACTGFGFAHTWGTTPRRKLFVTDQFGRERYYRARQVDEWPGEDYEGSSVLGAMKAAHEDGLIKSYHSAYSLAEIVYAVSYHGPVEIGVNWYEGMFDTTSTGYVYPTGDLAGGHALAIGGVNMANKNFILYNSWGKSWGRDGAALLNFSDMERLLHEGGEVILPKKPILPLW